VPHGERETAVTRDDLAAKLAGRVRIGVDLHIRLTTDEGLPGLFKFARKDALCTPIARFPHVNDISRGDRPRHCAFIRARLLTGPEGRYAYAIVKQGFRTG